MPDPVTCFFWQHKFIVVDCLLHIVIFHCESMFPQILSVDFWGLVLKCLLPERFCVFFYQVPGTI